MHLQLVIAAYYASVKASQDFKTVSAIFQKWKILIMNYSMLFLNMHRQREITSVLVQRHMREKGRCDGILDKACRLFECLAASRLSLSIKSFTHS